MKTGTFTTYIEVPLEVSYAAYPEEKQTRDYPGIPAHIEVDHVQWPDEKLMGKLIDDNAEQIKEEAEEDAK